MKSKLYKTREEIVSLLRKKGFVESADSNKSVAKYIADKGNISVTLTPGAVIEIRDKGVPIAHFRQPIFNIVVNSSNIVLMTGTDDNIDWCNLYIRRNS